MKLHFSFFLSIFLPFSWLADMRLRKDTPLCCQPSLQIVVYKDTVHILLSYLALIGLWSWHNVIT